MGDLDVLIVDDHGAMRTLLRTVLERAGVQQIREAVSAEEAWLAIEDAPPSLILTDRRLPKADGLALIARVRADRRCAHTRILLITGHADSALRDAAREAGADGVLGKPVSPRDLLAAIRDLYT